MFLTLTVTAARTVIAFHTISANVHTALRTMTALGSVVGGGSCLVKAFIIIQLLRLSLQVSLC